MSLAEPHALNLNHLGLTEWTPADQGQVNDGFLHITGPCRFNPFEVNVDAGSGIEWRSAPSQHIGALSPQLLYRNTRPTLFNSFLSVIPSALTGGLADVDIVARFFTPDACHPKMRYVYQAWVVARLTDLRSLNFYYAAIYRNRDNSSDVVSIWRVAGNSRTEIVSAPLGIKIDWSKPWHCRFNVVDRDLRAKWWNYDAIEPANWDLYSTDDSLIRSGMIGFASTVHGEIDHNIWGLDWYAWSSDPNKPASLYPNENV